MLLCYVDGCSDLSWLLSLASLPFFSPHHLQYLFFIRCELNASVVEERWSPCLRLISIGYVMQKSTLVPTSPLLLIDHQLKSWLDFLSAICIRMSHLSFAVICNRIIDFIYITNTFACTKYEFKNNECDRNINFCYNIVFTAFLEIKLELEYKQSAI